MKFLTILKPEHPGHDFFPDGIPVTRSEPETVELEGVGAANVFFLDVPNLNDEQKSNVAAVAQRHAPNDSVEDILRYINEGGEMPVSASGVESVLVIL